MEATREQVDLLCQCGAWRCGERSRGESTQRDKGWCGVPQTIKRIWGLVWETGGQQEAEGPIQLYKPGKRIHPVERKERRMKTRGQSSKNSSKSLWGQSGREKLILW
jgi:hypothetical protein